MTLRQISEVTHVVLLLKFSADTFYRKAVGLRTFFFFSSSSMCLYVSFVCVCARVYVCGSAFFNLIESFRSLQATTSDAEKKKGQGFSEFRSKMYGSRIVLDSFRRRRQIAPMSFRSYLPFRRDERTKRRETISIISRMI